MEKYGLITAILICVLEASESYNFLRSLNVLVTVKMCVVVSDDMS